MVGTDNEGRSAVIVDDTATPATVRPNGAALHELWRQRNFPATAGDDGYSHSEMDVVAPGNGTVVRTYTLPPESAVDGGSSAQGLHTSDSLFVITVVSGRIRVDLEVGGADLEMGESIVLPGSMHDMRNVSDAPATLVYTAFHLQQ
ncbi:hypothetical protein CH253_18705 [Rhodococcus sp. 06-156-3C]|nr:hypothetical protein CH248_27905 [Rhodococcus sp. 06-156-4a]OZD17960.1 hypothetical protein CH253_18705 [Rhodococcus sp. 06-156-3C]OZD20684.1 hypothetical protein CH280_03860 [Rhodococcus sp. 06-156-4C]OZD30597.1 hypothetical protein CH247_14870 [Rhodococcus sp. 06-156-3b]OZD32630.1 hypothetical protein CH284_20390 [Rhodococcus sp. 06-156-3]OZF64959.1 hypothetical protein CH290_10195 [Rhodococcus sp. 06-156-4]